MLDLQMTLKAKMLKIKLFMQDFLCLQLKNYKKFIQHKFFFLKNLDKLLLFLLQE